MSFIAENGKTHIDNDCEIEELDTEYEADLRITHLLSSLSLYMHNDKHL